jgi:hypothetical protein
MHVERHQENLKRMARKGYDDCRNRVFISVKKYFPHKTK